MRSFIVMAIHRLNMVQLRQLGMVVVICSHKTSYPARLPLTWKWQRHGRYQ
jgi:hypothetical protein